MGQTDSTPKSLYEHALEMPCLLPDVGIDESLLKYSGLDSNAVLRVNSNDMANSVPGYIGRLGSVLGPMTSIPNAVGLGALVISLIIEIAIKSGTQTGDNTYGLLQRVFGEEKASKVRDTMSEYLRRHRMYMKNNQQLRLEISRLEKQLSNHLTALRNSLLYDGQMNTRGFKIWVNRAAFHVQMLIHEARLDMQTGEPAKDYLNAIEAAIDLYLHDLDNLLEKYKTYKIKSGIIWYKPGFSSNYMSAVVYVPALCAIINSESKNCVLYLKDAVSCIPPEIFMDSVYSNYEPIKVLKSYFLNIKNSLNSLIQQRVSFTLPSAAG